MPEEFDISNRRIGDDAVVLRIAGDVDLFTIPEFKRAVNEAIATRCRSVVVDFAATSFLESASLGVLIGAHRRLRREGRSLLLTGCGEPVVRVLRITGLDAVFTMAESPPGAAGPGVPASTGRRPGDAPAPA